MGYVGEDISKQSAAETAWLLLMLTVKTKERGMMESRNGSSKEKQVSKTWKILKVSKSTEPVTLFLGLQVL